MQNVKKNVLLTYEKNGMIYKVKDYVGFAPNINFASFWKIQIQEIGMEGYRHIR